MTRRLSKFFPLLALFCCLWMQLPLLSHGQNKGAIVPKVCRLPIKELQAGVKEADFGVVKAKFEDFNRVAKMKLVSSLNEDWTSIPTEENVVGRISGFRGNGDDAELIAELVVVKRQLGYDWGMFIKDRSSLKGSVYFSLENQNICVQSTVTKWKNSVRKVFGEINNSASINLQRDLM